MPRNESSVSLSRSARAKNQQLAIAFARWLYIRNLSPSTQANYRHSLRVFLDFLGVCDVCTVTYSQLRIFIVDLAEKATNPNVIRAHIIAVRQFFRFLAIVGLVRYPPATLLHLPKAPRRLPRYLSEDEASRFMRAAISPRERALAELFYGTGCRVNEIRMMRVDHVNFRAGEIRVLGKGNKERSVLFGRKAATALRIFLAGRKTGFIFRNRAGRPLTVRTIGSIVGTLARRAGLSGVHPHTLRHSFATTMLNRGADLRYVQELLGHASVVSTQIYTHLAIADLTRTHEKFHPHGAKTP